MKAKSEQLLSEIGGKLSQYLMQGYLNLNSLIKKIEPNLNIENIQKLLRIHFVLTEKNEHNDVGVIDFIKNLTHRIRRLKTAIKPEMDTFEGLVKGRINWKKTIILRCKVGPDAENCFVCDKREKDYNISENLVLKRLLQIIYNIVINDLKIGIQEGYDWLRDWVKEKELKGFLKRVFLKNIYLRKIDLSNIKITDRMINNAKKSRNNLYRDAATLLSRYRKLMRYEIDPSEAKELLKNTFIEPARTEVLFELYWIIKIINQFEAKDLIFELIEPSKNVIAKWKLDEYYYKIYHDSVGPFEFKESINDLYDKYTEDNYIKREIKVLKKIEDMTSINKNTLWCGRPDIILEKRDENNNVISIFIGEVKYTDNRLYAIQGLKELLEYMALIKENKNYIEKDINNLFDNLEYLSGALFVDNIKDLNIIEEENIKIYMYGKDRIIKI